MCPYTAFAHIQFNWCVNSCQLILPRVRKESDCSVNKDVSIEWVLGKPLRCISKTDSLKQRLRLSVLESTASVVSPHCVQRTVVESGVNSNRDWLFELPFFIGRQDGGVEELVLGCEGNRLFPIGFRELGEVLNQHLLFRSLTAVCSMMNAVTV